MNQNHFLRQSGIGLPEQVQHLKEAGYFDHAIRVVDQMLAEDGVFLCSGIIDTRAHEVEAALKKNGLSVTRKREKNGWVALEAKLG